MLTRFPGLSTLVQYLSKPETVTLTKDEYIAMQAKLIGLSA